MDPKLRYASLAALAVGLIATLVLLLVPITVTSGGTAPAVLLPAAEWTLEHSGRGELIGIHRDRAAGVTRSYEVRSVDRGDAAGFRLRDGLALGSAVEAGDTLGLMRSAELSRQAEALEGLTNVLVAEAATFSEGAKAELVRAAEGRIAQTRALLGLQTGIVSRLETLQGSGVVSLDELERARAEVVALEGEVAVQEAELEVLQSGARPTERRLALARVDEARRNALALGARRAAQVVVSPIRGTVVRSARDSVLVTVADLEHYVALMALPADATVARDQELLLPDGAVCRVVHVEPTLEAEGVRAATCLTSGTGPAGAVMELQIASEPVLLRDWFLDVLRGLLVGRA
ncbi:MAG: hypothetical protein JJ896_10000 [Rhodothermales bacterium]|nr:hypothetical protein [Rhodothermales bacterium]MBO6779972.1 hypothetical protein [Rhodothermales bacterium]